jgi:PBP1b-binding outer membrane lipoprotein LpoB
MSDAPPATPTPSAAPVPAKSGNRVLIIIICVVIGFFLLIGGCVASCWMVGHYVSKKAREVSNSAQKNPVYASLSLAASLNPNVEVLSKDEAAGKITVRNKTTGETQTINANDFSKENISQALEKMNQGFTAAAAAAAGAAKAANEASAPAVAASPSGESENASGSAATPAISVGKAAAMAGILQEFPGYLPPYPGGTTLEASQNAVGGFRTGRYVFATPDKVDAVVDFYEKKATSAGFSQMGRNGDSNEYGPTASVNLMRPNPQGTITLNAESKQGGTVQVTIEISEIGK